MMTDNFSSYKLNNNFISFPVVSIKENAPFGTQKTVSLDFDEELAREGRQ